MTLTNINTLLAAMPFAERMAYGGQVFVVGILTVFAVLTILWFVLVIFRLFAYDIPAKRKAKAHKTKIVEVPAEAPAEVSPAPETQESDGGELIAVITAAIEAYNSQSGSSLPFRVVSYKRVKGANGWNGNDTNETI